MSGYHLSAEIIYFPLRKSHLYLVVCNIFCLESILPRGLTARISGFHPGGPGSTPGVGILFCPVQIEFHLATDWLGKVHKDEVAEWLRRWTANPMGSARVGSNPILVEFFCHACGKKK